MSTKELTVRKVGRPTKYKPEMCQQAIELGKIGASKQEIAMKLGISITCAFYDWQEKYPEFQEAIKEAELQAMVWWEIQGREKTFNSAGFNPTAYIFQMKNRFSSQYKDRSPQEGHNGGHITIEFKEFCPPPGSVVTQIELSVDGDD